MRGVAIAFIIISFVSVSFCWADEAALKEAYSLYYKGEKEKALTMLEEYVQDNPDASVYYFLGYAYYELEDMDRANEYFSEAFRLKDFYSPIPPEESQ